METIFICVDGPPPVKKEKQSKKKKNSELAIVISIA